MGVLASSNARTYYQKSFGPLNELITLKNHTFLALDAPSLIDEDYQRNARGVSFDQWEPIPGGAVEAVQRTAAREYPNVLLFREAEKSGCHFPNRTISPSYIVVSHPTVST